MIDADTPWDAIAELISLLRDETFAVGQTAGDRLGEWGAAAVPALRTELAVRHPISAQRVLRALGQTGAASAVDILLDFNPAGNADFEAARLAGLNQVAVQLAARATAADLVPLIRLIDALRESSPSIAVVLARTLQRLARAEPSALYRRALPILRRSGGPAALAEVAQTIDSATEAWKGPPHAPKPTVALTRFAFEIETLLDLMRRGDYAGRKAAGERLAALGLPAIPALTAELAARHPLGAPRALIALGLTGEPSAVEPIVAFSVENDMDLESARDEALKAVAGLLAARAPTAGETSPLIRLFAALPPFGKEAAALARSLAWLAKNAPTPSLRAALRPLKGGLLHPVPAEFGPIRKAIEQATAHWKDLPRIASRPPPDTVDLPLPSENPDAD